MMSEQEKVVPFSRYARSGDGGGPEDPMIEARVARLEGDVSEIKAILRRLEPAIVGMIGDSHDFARRSDMGAVREKLAETREEMREIKGEMRSLLPSRTFILWMIGLFVALAGLFLRAAS